MKAVQDTIAACYLQYNMAVYVAKIIPGYEAL
jgi:chloramphenicol 3-O-phosphotransferase